MHNGFRAFVLTSEGISRDQNDWFVMEVTPEGYKAPSDWNRPKMYKRRKDAKEALLANYPGIKQGKGCFVLNY